MYKVQLTFFFVVFGRQLQYLSNIRESFQAAERLQEATVRKRRGKAEIFVLCFCSSEFWPFKIIDIIFTLNRKALAEDYACFFSQFWADNLNVCGSWPICQSSAPWEPVSPTPPAVTSQSQLQVPSFSINLWTHLIYSDTKWALCLVTSVIPYFLFPGKWH